VRRRRVAALALAVALLAAERASADGSWRPLLTRDGVGVEERSAPGRTLPELRATVEIDAGLFDVLAVITDVPRQTEWMHDCEESRLLRRDGADVTLLYNRTGAPWPVSDRDVVLRSETRLLDPGRRVAVRFANTIDPGAPPIDGIVRMPRLVGEYELVSLAPERTRVTYRLDIDPGGSLPSWAVSRTTRDTPLYTLLGLRRQVAATRGAYADFVASWSERR
jgi:hypothetical protein